MDFIHGPRSINHEIWGSIVQAELSEFERLLERLSEFRDNTVREAMDRMHTAISMFERSVQCHVDVSQKDFIRLADLMDRMRPEINAFRKREAPGFNIFKLLRMERYEVAFHTPMLAALLSPAGSHGQGRLFLESFLIKCCGIEPEEANDPAWYALPEAAHVDLRVAHDHLRKAFH